MNRIQTLTFSAWLLALIATLGSLFFSEIMKYPPCVLCWYQRIGMYPLVAIFLIGFFQGGKETWIFSLPLIGFGWFFSIYHNLLHYEIIPESAAPCMEGVSCAAIFINWLGFITIPMLSFVAFTILAIISFLLKREIKNEK